MTEPFPSQLRRAVRHRAQEDALAVQGATIGQILDVSRSGIAFKYIAADQEQAAISWLRIISCHDSFHLPELRIEEVYDTPLAPENPYACLRMRRRGLLFRELSGEQDAALERFIADYTLGPL